MDNRWTRLFRPRATSGSELSGADRAAERDRDLVFSLHPARIPHPGRLRHLKKVLNARELLTLRWLTIVAVISGLLVVGIQVKSHLHLVATDGGTLTEGLVGVPQTINPILARPSTVDASLTKLLFRGLTKVDSSFNVVPDLAASITPSSDGKTVTIVLKDDQHWSDEEPITSNDIKYTFDTIKDSEFNSPYQSLFTPITTDIVDDLTVKLTLSKAMPNLMAVLSLGLLPQHVWLDASGASMALAEYNIKPITNGSYKFQSVTKDRSGNVKAFTFVQDKTSGAIKPHIKTISIKFYPDQNSALEALKKDGIDLLGSVPEDEAQPIEKNFPVASVPYNQVMGIWFNQKTNVALRSKEVRQALAMVVDRSTLLKPIGRAGTAITDPVLPGHVGYSSSIPHPTGTIDQANTLLDQAGWKLSGSVRTKSKVDLAFSFTIPNDEPYTTMANTLVAAWKKIGAKVAINAVDPSHLPKDVVKPRSYDALLFGQMYGADSDLYPYWHSSQQSDPGYALAIWSSASVDKDLTEARTADETKKIALLKDAQTIIASDVPAILLYQANEVFSHAKNVRGWDTVFGISPADMFSNFQQLYVRTKFAWK